MFDRVNMSEITCKREERRSSLNRVSTESFLEASDESLDLVFAQTLDSAEMSQDACARRSAFLGITERFRDLKMAVDFVAARLTTPEPLDEPNLPLIDPDPSGVTMLLSGSFVTLDPVRGALGT